MTDVATPITTQRFTYNGQAYGYQLKLNMNDILSMMLNKPRLIHGLSNTYLVGQSSGGGGIPGCAMMGRKTIQVICKQEKKKFLIKK